jgi:hypothetical protein
MGGGYNTRRTRGGDMQRKIFSWLFLVTGVLIGLGAFGHASNARHLSAEFAKFPAIDANAIAIILVVWHFCTGCMLVFGAICVGSWWRFRQGVQDVFFAPVVIGVLYVATGVAAVAYTGMAFFFAFVLLGGLLMLSAAMLRRS